MHCCAKLTAQLRPASPFLLQGTNTQTPVYVTILSVLTRREEGREGEEEEEEEEEDEDEEEEEEEDEEEEDGLLLLSQQGRYYRSARGYI